MTRDAHYDVTLLIELHGECDQFIISARPKCLFNIEPPLSEQVNHG